MHVFLLTKFVTFLRIFPFRFVATGFILVSKDIHFTKPSLKGSPVTDFIAYVRLSVCSLNHTTHTSH